MCDQGTLKTRRLKPATGLWKIQLQWVVTPNKEQTNSVHVSYFQKLESWVLCMIVPKGRTRRQSTQSGLSWQNRLPVQLVSRTCKKRGSEFRNVYHDGGRSGIIACCTAAYIKHNCKAAPASLTWTSNPRYLIRLKFLIILFLLHDGATLFLFYIFLFAESVFYIWRVILLHSLADLFVIVCISFFIWPCFIYTT